MGKLKIENMNMADVKKAPANTVQIKTEVEDTSKDTHESTQKNETKAVTKHVITYIGSSEHIDSKGHKWHKGDEMTYDNAEFVTRKDLEYMVKYGEMKHVVVTI